MVAAPETIVQQQQQEAAVAGGETSVSSGKLASLANGNGAHGQEKENGQVQDGTNGSHAGMNGANDLTVVDAQAPTMKGSLSRAPSSHNNHFDPTPPAAAANIPPPDIARHIPCRFFPLGTCKYGDQCAFSHGLPGIAGSPGVPAVALPGQQSEGEYQDGSQMNGGAPMYYPEQGYEYGGYPPQFAPQQGYQPFPHFQQYPQHYQQGPPPQAYYQPPPPPQMMVDASITSPSPSAALNLPESTPAPTSPDSQRPLAPLPASFPSPPTSHGLPLVPGPPAASYAPYHPQNYAPQGAEYTSFPPQQAPSSPPTTFGPDGAPLRSPPTQSLHTFFQTSSAPPTSLPLAPANGAFPKGPAQPMGIRRPGGLGFAGPKPARKFATPRPHCSFFEANRCRSGDECNFFHLLPDGRDARTLGQGMLGADGRTEHPEKQGGKPPMWVLNAAAYQSTKANGRPMMNGGFPGVPREMKPRNRFEEEQQRNALAASQGPAAVAGPDSEEKPVDAVAAPAKEVNEQKAPRIVPGTSAPSLVAAIQGLTRRIPPASGPQGPTVNGHGPSTRPPKQQQQQQAHSAPQQPRQKVPSVDDFPALSTPSSPPLETTVPSTPVAEIVKAISRPVSPLPSTTETPAPAPAPASTPSLAEVVAAEPVEPAAPRQPLARSETSDSDFVIVTHAEATPPSATSSAPVATPAPAAPAPAAPRVVLSFASAAARGAAIPNPVVPERRRPAVVVAAKVESETKEPSSGGGKKKKNKNRGENKEKANAAAALAPVAIKA